MRKVSCWYGHYLAIASTQSTSLGTEQVSLMVADEALSPDDVDEYMVDECLARCGLTPKTLADLVVFALDYELGREPGRGAESVAVLRWRASVWRAVLALRTLMPFLDTESGSNYASLSANIDAAVARIDARAALI
jgi:hypothetical protein